MTEELKVNTCPEFPHFGARYPDAVCIDGYLWDLDSGDEPGVLSIGGDDPCPFCNTEQYLEWAGVGDLEGPTKEEVMEYIESLKQKYA